MRGDERHEPAASAQPPEAAQVRGHMLAEALLTAAPAGRPFEHADARLLATVLRAVPLFSRLGSRDLRRIAERATVRHVPAGHSVVREGFSAQGFFVLLTGTAVVRAPGRPDRQLAAEEWFGELGLLDGAPRTASVITTSDAWLLKLARSDFLALLDRHASIGRGVAEGLAGWLRSLHEEDAG